MNLIGNVTKIIAAVFLILALTACGGAREQVNEISALSQIEADGVVRVGWAPYAPYVSADPQTKEPEGYYVDLIEVFAGEAGWEVDWVETTWGTMISDLKSDRYDFMGAPVFRTIGRAKNVEFTRPIGYFGLSAVVRQDDTRFSEIGDFNSTDITIAVTQGEVGEEFAQRNLPNATIVARQSGDISLALVDVLQGRADVGIADAWTIAQFTAEHPERLLDMFEDAQFGRVGAGWFVEAGDDELRVFLNTSIDWLESSGEIARVQRDYPDLPEIGQ